MNHQRIQNALSAYLDNELSPSMQKRVEAHLRSCQECTDMLAAFQHNREKIRELVHPAPPLKDMVMAKIHEQFQDELSAYLDNELAPDMRNRIEAHLHSCNECSDMLAAFQRNRERIKDLEHPAPASIHNAVMAQIRQQAVKTSTEKPSWTLRLPDIGRWMPDFGRWFLRPITAGATGLLTLALIVGALYFFPTTSQYEETLDFYFGIYTEQVTDNPLSANISSVQSEESVESNGDTDLFLNLYLENIGN
ncbi:MAG: zf-HC2 domain-containing protein [Candidatus Poribacteria bacterium]|nr:zf-HC2 domain-containing protein [Candidatus Poribacteria bacterium]